jgi:hypothetical protein
MPLNKGRSAHARYPTRSIWLLIVLLWILFGGFSWSADGQARRVRRGLGASLCLTIETSECSVFSGSVVTGFVMACSLFRPGVACRCFGVLYMAIGVRGIFPLLTLRG